MPALLFHGLSAEGANAVQMPDDPSFIYVLDGFVYKIYLSKPLWVNVSQLDNLENF